MSSTVNKKKIDHQRVRRQQLRSVKKARLAQQRRSIKISADAAFMSMIDEKTALLSTVSSSSVRLPLTEHHRRARKSNPTAPIQLSKKKEKRMRKLAKITKLLSRDTDGEVKVQVDHSRLMQE